MTNWSTKLYTSSSTVSIRENLAMSTLHTKQPCPEPVEGDRCKLSPRYQILQ